MTTPHEPLRVLTLAKTLVKDTHVALQCPAFQKHPALRDQLSRAALSVLSNIAEGDGRASTKDGGRFFRFAIASAEESKVQIELAAEIGALPREAAVEMHAGYSKVCRMLKSLVEVRNLRG
jgi:four helix bundle protein